jgi:hypothetical protein
MMMMMSYGPEITKIFLQSWHLTDKGKQFHVNFFNRRFRLLLSLCMCFVAAPNVIRQVLKTDSDNSAK